MTINTQKFLGKESTGIPDYKKQNPKITFGSDTSFVGNASRISQYSGGKLSAESVQNLSIVSAKLIDVDNFLKDSLVLDKVKAGIDRKKKEKDARDKKELDREDTGDDKDEKTGKFKLPGLPFASRIKKWILKLLFGWLALKLFDKGFAGALFAFAKKAAKVLDFVMEWGGRIFNGLVTVVDWGYKAYDWTRGKVEDIFGKKGVEAFDAVAGKLKWLTIVVGSIAMGFAAMALHFGLLWKKSLATKALAVKGSAVTTGVTAGGTVVTTSGGVAAGGAKGIAALTGLGTGAVVAVAGGVGLLASAIGEGAFQLNKWGEGQEENLWEKYKKGSWWNPADWMGKIGWGAAWAVMKTLNATFGTIGVLLDVIGAPFRYLIELIRYPFLDEAGKKKQRENLKKFDERIRESFRKIFHFLSFGQIGKGGKGSWGSIFGDPSKEKKNVSGKNGDDSDAPKSLSDLTSKDIQKSAQNFWSGGVTAETSGSQAANSISSFASYDNPKNRTVFVPVPQEAPVISADDEVATVGGSSDESGEDSVGDELYAGKGG